MIYDISHAFPSCDYRILNFEKIDSESFFVEPVFVLWEREKSKNESAHTKFGSQL